MMSHAKKQLRAGQRGAGLLEVLVAVLVLPPMPPFKFMRHWICCAPPILRNLLATTLLTAKPLLAQ